MNNAGNTRPGTGGRLAELTAYECWGLLDSEEIARVAWHGRDGVAIVPVNYTVADGSLWFRTSPSSTLGRECAGQALAIEMDHLDRATRSAWSVVVSGVGELVDAADVPDVLAGLHVWPSGNRPLFIRVEPDDVTGRKLLGSAG
jgi:nitroimidazol reductase NimA-like FMN-containing flavoprotein (pyridoxamine 5'-phosphate oxidase superfamily)